MREIEIVEHSIVTTRKARVYTIGDRETAHHFWLVLHGYGQLASRIIRKFDHLDLAQHYILAPEALSRFYWDRDNNQVGASWMTMHDRLNEIDDYIQYLNLVWHSYLQPHFSLKIQFHVLSFSQGSSTAGRWLNQVQHEVSSWINWAGEYPPELDYHSKQSFWNGLKLFYRVGNRDKFVTQSYKDKINSFIVENQLDIDLQEFDGKHEINRSELSALIDQYIL